MINKVNLSPAFTSSVRVVYDDSSVSEDFYKSNKMKKQLDILAKNGNKDVVTIYPEEGGRDSALVMNVVRKDNGKLSCASGLIYSPKEVISTYKECLKDFKDGLSDKIPDDVTIKEYIA